MTVEATLLHGARALMHLQSQEGRWTEYALPVGVSDEWVTAFVGLALAEAAVALDGNEALMLSAMRGWRALNTSRTRKAGFGFNASVDPDADSTATFVLLGQTLGLAAPVKDLEFLRLHARADGGFATFQTPEAWAQSHVCVTPVVALALEQAGALNEPDAVAQYALARMAEDGTWESYWWPGPFYATAAWLRFFDARPDLRIELGTKTRELSVCSVMDLALAAEIAMRWPLDEADQLVSKLTEYQGADGMWPGSRSLRVTVPELGEVPRGEVFADGQGIMTTAMAVRTLALYCQSCDG